MNFHSNKTKKIISRVIIIVLVASMVIPVILSALM